jgi:uncharacterized repeat protein (TIGR01451 family)
MRRLTYALVALFTATTISAALAQGGGGGGGGGTGADLQISGAASSGSPSPGAVYNYTFQVRNTGPQSVADAAFTNTLPAGATYRGVTVQANTQSTCATGTNASGATTVSCDLVVMPKSAQATITVAANAPTTSGTFADTASITSNVPDPQLSNNSVTVNIKVNVPTCNFGGQTPMRGVVMLKNTEPGTSATTDFELQVDGVNYWVYLNLFDASRPLTQVINLNCKTVPSSFIQVGNFVDVTGTIDGTTTTPDGVTMPSLDANIVQVETFLDMAT